MNVLLENTPFVKFVGNYSQDPGGIFSIYIDDFTPHFFMVVCVQTVNKITWWLEDMNFSFSRNILLSWK